MLDEVIWVSIVRIVVQTVLSRGLEKAGSKKCVFLTFFLAFLYVCSGLQNAPGYTWRQRRLFIEISAIVCRTSTKTGTI